MLSSRSLDSSDLPPNRSGTYVLFLQMNQSRRIRIGKQGIRIFNAGYYGYAGSAFGPGGLRARIRHHLKISKRPHWHIDYLRRRSSPMAVWWSASHVPREHDWAAILSRSKGEATGVKNFGASDCRCATHLFYFNRKPRIEPFRDALMKAELPERIQTTP